MHIKIIIISIQFIVLFWFGFFSQSSKNSQRTISSAGISASAAKISCRQAMHELLISSNIEDNIVFWHALKENASFINPKYFNHDKFDNLAADPDHNFKQTHTSQLEAISGIYAQDNGILAHGIERGPEGTEFVDGDGVFWDVKTPVSPLAEQDWEFNFEKAGKSIKDKLEAINSIGDINILVDLSYTREVDARNLKLWINENIDSTLHERIRYIIVPDSFI